MNRSKLLDLKCTKCERPMEALRPTKKYCSESCRRGALYGRNPERSCRLCGSTFLVVTRSDANRQYCSKQCSKTSQQKYVGEWHKQNPEAVRGYRRAYEAKNPDYYKSNKAIRRLETLAALGGACVACGANNPPWLHIDYIPTCRGLRYRHPRGKRFVLENLEDFRILCANHHYELTLTGRIEGTEICQ